MNIETEYHPLTSWENMSPTDKVYKIINDAIYEFTLCQTLNGDVFIMDSDGILNPISIETIPDDILIKTA